MILNELTDNFGRQIDYLRLSITDRCDFRCTYCMAEDMTFLPRSEVLTLEELARTSASFVELGVRKIRVTGGEPLVRRDALLLLQEIGKLKGLTELCITTNGSRLAEHANALADAGVTRVNISLDSLQAERFQQLTRFGELARVLAGIEAARRAGFKKIKINAVLLRHYNLDEALDLASYALERDLDISFIEEMPLGVITSHEREHEYISSEEVRSRLAKKFKLTPVDDSTGGPSKYWKVANYQSRIGFISPHSHNFCASCNRVRVTAEGRLLLCLGNEYSVDLKAVLRSHEGDQELKKLIIQAMHIKPEKHEFNLHDEPQILRFMNTTGG